ncbi:mitochondrial 54S ribosomal protein bL36m RTC6 [Rhodotorula paludigena]|uniref:mitochondrial 54S ribosomal protein bL36m RTC6 n=1 Tax=Rhodotorula paludigena TaxID=86838 RepID=UPI00317164E0
MLSVSRHPARALRASLASTPSRSLSSLLTPASHPARCGCARCASRTSPVSTIVQTPTQPGALAGQSRPASRLAPNEASHPRGCGCARCAPRAAPAASGIVGVPSRPSAGANAAAKAVGEHRGYKVRSSVKKLCSGCYTVRRQGTLFILCQNDPKHKQRQG